MNKRILFVDDDPLLLELAALLAEPEVEHWKCVRAENHTHALGMLAAKKIDAIVVDFRRSAVEGPQLLDQVRRLYPQHPHQYFRTGRTGNPPWLPARCQSIFDLRHD